MNQLHKGNNNAGIGGHSIFIHKDRRAVLEARTRNGPIIYFREDPDGNKIIFLSN